MGAERPRLILPPGIQARPDALGTDTTTRGEWRKTNNTIAVAQAMNDVKVNTGMSGPELFGALVENVIAAIQGSCAPSQWQEMGDAVCVSIMRRMQP